MIVYTYVKPSTPRLIAIILKLQVEITKRNAKINIKAEKSATFCTGAIKGGW